MEGGSFGDRAVQLSCGFSRALLQARRSLVALQNPLEQLCKLSVGGGEHAHILNPSPKE